MLESVNRESGTISNTFMRIKSTAVWKALKRKLVFIVIVGFFTSLLSFRSIASPFHQWINVELHSLRLLDAEVFLINLSSTPLQSPFTLKKSEDKWWLKRDWFISRIFGAYRHSRMWKNQEETWMKLNL